MAVSISLPRLLSDAHLPGRGAEPLVTLVGVLALTSAVLLSGSRPGSSAPKPRRSG